MNGPETFATASSNLTTFKRLNAAPDPNKGDQVARFSVVANNSSGSATLTVCLVKNNVVIASESATCTPTTRRTASDNSSGGYLCTVAFTASGNDKCDLLGISGGGVAVSKQAASPQAHDSNCEWWYGITGLSTVSSADVYYAVSPKV